MPCEFSIHKANFNAYQNIYIDAKYRKFPQMCDQKIVNPSDQLLHVSFSMFRVF